MISIAQGIATVIGCMVLQQPIASCVPFGVHAPQQTAEEVSYIPKKTGPAVDVALTAESVLVWDLKTGAILYERNGDAQRPVASINKLLSTVVAHSLISPNKLITIPPEAKVVQRKGVGIKLIPGHHASAESLFAASLIPSANDAIVSLAIAAKGSEQAFVEYANAFAASHGLFHTKLANSTGLEEGDQYSTAKDVRIMLMMAYNDLFLRPFLSQQKGELQTIEGTSHKYVSTDKLLGTYLPVLAGKTGYTLAAKENLAIITQGPQGQKLGAVILGSNDRFQDMKTVVEWTYRNYTWP